MSLEEKLCARFGDHVLEEVMEEFMRVRQEGSVEEYQDKFEGLRLQLERIMLELGENYFLSIL